MRQIPMTSLSQDWRTPLSLFTNLHKEFNFDCDPCPAHSLVDGLSLEWGSCSYVNPPFKDIAKWVKKGWEESQKGKTVVLLIPARTDTRWWHDFCMKASEIRFLKGRIKYEGARFNAPFPSCVVVFTPTSRHEDR